VCVPEIWLKGHDGGGIVHLLWLGRLKRFKTCSEKKKTHKGEEMQDRSGRGGGRGRISDEFIIHN